MQATEELGASLRVLSILFLICSFSSAGATATSTSKPMSFNECVIAVAEMTRTVGRSRWRNISTSNQLTMTRICTIDGSVIVTCSRSDRKMVITRSSKSCGSSSVLAQRKSQSQALKNRNGDLSKLQSELNSLNFEAGVADGLMGPKTESAIEAFYERYSFLKIPQDSNYLLITRDIGCAKAVQEFYPNFSSAKKKPSRKARKQININCSGGTLAALIAIATDNRKTEKAAKKRQKSERNIN